MESDVSRIPYVPLDDAEENEEQNVKTPWWLRALYTVTCRCQSEEEEKLEGQPVTFRELFRFATAWEKFIVCLGVFGSMLLGLKAPMMSVIGGLVVTVYVEEKHPIGNAEFLTKVLFINSFHVVAGLLDALGSFLEYICFNWVSERVVARIRREFISSVLAQNAGFLDTTSAGKLSSQLNSNVDRIRDGISEKVGVIVRSILSFISTIAVSFYIDWRITLIMVGMGPVCAFTSGMLAKFAERPAKAHEKATEEANGVAEECISNVKTVVSCNGQRTMIEKYTACLQDAVKASIRIGFVDGFWEGLLMLFLYLFWMAGLTYGIIAYHEGIIKEAGNVLIVTNAVMSSSFIMGSLGPHILSILKARVAAAVVYKTIDSKPNIDARSDNGIDLKEAKCSIDFRDVHLTYSTRSSPALKGLSWSVEQGQTVALVGKSGCGKSTSISLISRLFSAVQGQILIGDEPIENFNVSNLRQCIGVVSQEPALFSGTIRENIGLGRDLNDSQIQEAARTANAHSFIMGLEKGYGTILGPSGVALSGGQKQRIAIARAIATNPKILLLDEATSALDTHSERIVQTALNKACAGRTTVVVAHRLSTIKDVDRVFVIDEGKVIEDGTYEELSQRESGVFAKMVSLQEVDDRMRESVEGDKTPSEEEEEDIELSPEKIQPRLLTRSTSQLSETAEHTYHKESFPSMEGGVWELLKVDKSLVAMQIGAASVKGLEQFVLVFAWNYVFAALYEEDYKDLLIWTTIGNLGIVIFASIGIWVSYTVASWVAEKILLKLRVACLTSLLHRPIAYFDQKETSPAACAVALTQQPPLAVPAVDRRASSFYENVIAVVTVTVACFFFCWPNAIVSILCGAIFISIFYFMHRAGVRANEKYEKADTTGELAIELFSNVRAVQVLAVENHFISKFTDIQNGSKAALWNRTLNRALVHTVCSSFAYFTDALATALGAYFVYLGQVTINQLYTSEVCVSSVAWAVIQMAPNFNDLIASSSAAKKLFSLVNPHPVMDGKKKPRISGSVSSHSVSFAYPSRPSKMVANALTFNVGAGRSLAFVGPSGGGKSTVVNLIERFYEPTHGHMALDSTPLSSISLEHLRSNVALVSQEPVLFQGTILENIALGVEGTTIHEVREACKLANAADFIEGFPEAYDTAVGEKGRSLSGGQKQRVAIARALVMKPKVIVLDEATSALDSESEKVVKAALDVSAEGRTSIQIAHRLDTIKHCDEICFLESGRIVERGNHEELMRIGGKYAALVRDQRLLE